MSALPPESCQKSISRGLRRMPRLLLLLFLCAGWCCTSCEGEAKDEPLTQAEIIANAKRDATACANALLEGDFDAVIKYMPRRLIDMSGGDDGVRATFKKGTAEMDSQGAGFHKVAVGDPNPPKDVDGRLVTFVPEHYEMKVPGGRMVGDSWLMGVSGNGGRQWVFVDTVKLTKETLPKIFPEFVDKIGLPSVKPAVFEKD